MILLILLTLTLSSCATPINTTFNVPKFTEILPIPQTKPLQKVPEDIQEALKVLVINLGILKEGYDNRGTYIESYDKYLESTMKIINSK